jgi:cytosine/adenosine deaminase-related metal-dependent hydrolase
MNDPNKNSSIKAKFALLGEDLQLHQNVSIHLENNKIVSIEEERDINNNLLVIPSLYNAHVHTGDFNLRNQLPVGASLEELVGEIGIKQKYLRSASKIEKEKNILNSIIEAKKCFVGELNDFREEGFEGAYLYNSSIMLREVNIPLSTIDPWNTMDYEHDRLNVNIMSRPHGIEEAINLVKFAGLGIRDVYYYDIDFLLMLVKMWKDYCRPVQIHVAEDEKITNKWKKEFGVSEIEWIAENIQPDLVIHTNNATIEDYQILNEKNIAICLCPRSNKFTNRNFESLKMLNQELFNFENICFGTDNAMFNDLDVRKELIEMMQYIDISEEKAVKSLFFGGDRLNKNNDAPLNTGNVYQGLIYTLNKHQIKSIDENCSLLDLVLSL